MARKLSRREAIGAGILLVAAVLWVVGPFGKDPQKAGGAAAGRGQGRLPRIEEAPVVRMDILTASRESYEVGRRDLFKYSQRPPSAEEIRKLREEAERQRRLAEAEAKRRAEEEVRLQAQREEEARMAALRPPPPPPRPQPPPISLSYLGFLGPKDDKIAILGDGKDILLARKGEVIREQFRVVDVRFDKVVIGYTRPEFKNMTTELGKALR